MHDFPTLPQSVLRRVAERLVELGYLVQEGDPHFVYVDVRFWPKLNRPLIAAELVEIVDRLAHTTGLPSWIDTNLRAGCIILPLSEIERDIEGRPWSALELIGGGREGKLDLVRKAIHSCRDDGLPISVEVRPRPTWDGNQRAIVLTLRLADE